MFILSMRHSFTQHIGTNVEEMKQDKHIKLKVNAIGQDGNAIFVSIDRSTQLKKLVKAYCNHHSVDLNSVTFWFDGNQLQGDHCPAQLHMNDGDEIDAIFSEPSARITLKVSLKGKNENEIFFNIRRSNQLKKLMDVYCRRCWLDIDGVAFLFNGSFLQAEQTPDELQMVDGDEINVVFYDRLARMKLKVKCQEEGDEIFFSINRSTQLKKLMIAYCDHHSLDFYSVGFLFNEHLVPAWLSPDEMQMEDGDEIDAVLYDQSRRISLKVKGWVFGFEAFYRINRSTPLKNLMDVYCRRCCFDFDRVAFLFNGRLIKADQTPDELGMENGNEILAVLQLGSV